MSGRHRTRAAKSNLLIGSIAASVGVSSVLAAAIVDMVSPEPSAAANEGATRVAQDQPLTQEGRLVAVSSDSITAQSADGMTRTYAITPNTAGITEHSSLIRGERPGDRRRHAQGWNRCRHGNHRQARPGTYGLRRVSLHSTPK